MSVMMEAATSTRPLPMTLVDANHPQDVVNAMSGPMDHDMSGKAGEGLREGRKRSFWDMEEQSLGTADEASTKDDVNTERGEDVSETVGQPAAVGVAASNASVDATGSPAAKKPKVKLTAEEKARKDAALAAERAKKQEAKEAEKARKENEKAAKDAEKARKDAEKAKKDAEKAKKDAEKAAEKKAKEEVRQLKEEAKQKKEEVKQKAERAQMRLGNFFTTSTTPKDETKGNKPLLPNKVRASLSPAPSTSSVTDAALKSPSKSAVLPYDALFPEFFIHKDVTVAPVSRFSFDEEAREVISSKIDNFLSEEVPTTTLRFDPQQVFPSPFSKERGKKFMLVRDIMDEVSGNPRNVVDLTTESQHSQRKKLMDLLAKVPVKFLKFPEDVRPPYIGTYTSRPHHGMQRLARNPYRRDLPDLNYDYDSELEWVEDDEDAEDLKSENDEEEELDDGEEMAEFLDDENDELAISRRLAPLGDLEPTSTGLCWEDKHKRSSNVKMMPYRMEIIIDHKLKSIDPLSTAYWVEPKAMAPPSRVPLSSMTTNSKTPSVKSFFTGAPDDKSPAPATATASSDESKPAKMVRDEDMAEFRKAIQGSPLTKVGLVDSLSKQFPGNTSKVVSDTLMYIAHRERKKGSVWELRE